MGTTIRREPITTSIPAAPDYRFLNITNFGGIEKSSNPFVVESNTASDCLNVYVDEDNALSTRPRLNKKYNLVELANIHENFKILSVYDLHDGYLLHVVENGVVKMFKFSETSAGMDSPVSITPLDKIPTNVINVLFEQNNKIYINDDSGYKVIDGSIIYDVEGYVPLVTIGKHKRNKRTSDDGIITYEYDVEGSQFESPNLLSDKYRETYFWDNTTKTLPKASKTSDVIKNLDYVLLNHPELENVVVLHATKDYLIVSKESTINLGGLLCVSLSSSGSVTEIKSFEYSTAKAGDVVIYHTLADDVFMYSEYNKIAIHTFKYDYSKFTFVEIETNSSDFITYFDWSAGSTYSLKNIELSPGVDFLTAFYTDSSLPNRSFAMIFRITNDTENLFEISHFTTLPTSSVSLGDIDVNSVWIEKQTTDIGYYFLTIIGTTQISTGKSVLFGGCVSEVPWDPDFTASVIYNPDEITTINYNTMNIDYTNKSALFVETMNEKSVLIEMSWSETIDESKSPKNPYSITVEFEKNYSFSNVKNIVRLKQDNNGFYIITKNTIYFTNSLDEVDLQSIHIDVTDIYDFEPNGYVMFGKNENSRFFTDVKSVLKYVGSAENPSFEVTRHISTSNFDLTEINKLKQQFLKATSCQRFDNNTWFASDNYTFHTLYNNPTYIPLSGYNDLGESFEPITGLSIVNDNILAAYKRNRVYIITPITVGGQETYAYTETKNVVGNDVLNAPILTILTEMPVIVSYDGIYALNQLENVQSSDRITTLISEAINPKWLKESKTDIASCLTLNRLYWTYFILPHKKTSNALSKDYNHTKIYLLDNRTGSWFYWELPIYVISAMVKNNKTHFVTEDGELFTLETTDIINKFNKELTEYYDDLKKPALIPWYWTSQILSLNTINYSKRLVDTTFVLTDTDMSDEYALNYKFKAFRKNKNAETTELTLTNDIEYVESITKRTMIPRFNFLQFTLSNTEDDQKLNNNKLRLVGLGLKYVLLGGLY